MEEDIKQIDKIHLQNINEIKEILKTKSIRDFYKSGFEDFNYIENQKKKYFVLWSPDSFNYLIYKSDDFEYKINNLYENKSTK